MSPATSSGSRRSSASTAWPRRRSSRRSRATRTAGSTSVPCSTRPPAARTTSGAARSRTTCSAATSSPTSGTVTAIVVSFDEDRIDEVRGGVIQTIHDIVDPRLPAGLRAYYNGSLEISETYNRVTLDNQQKFTPPILLFTVLAIYAAFRSLQKTMLAMFAILISVLWTLGLYAPMGFSYNVLSSMLIPLVVVLAIADDVHIMQRWDEARRHDASRRRSRTRSRTC